MLSAMAAANDLLLLQTVPRVLGEKENHAKLKKRERPQSIKSILIIDDNPDIALTLQRIIRRGIMTIIFLKCLPITILF